LEDAAFLLYFAHFKQCAWKHLSSLCVTVCVCVYACMRYLSFLFNNCWNMLFGSTIRSVGQPTIKYCMLSKLFNWPVCMYWINLWHWTPSVAQALNNEICFACLSTWASQHFNWPHYERLWCMFTTYIYTFIMLTNHQCCIKNKLLQSSVSHDPSEIFLICWFGAQETMFIIIITVENIFSVWHFRCSKRFTPSVVNQLWYMYITTSSHGG